MIIPLRRFSKKILGMRKILKKVVTEEKNIIRVYLISKYFCRVQRYITTSRFETEHHT